MTPPGEAPGRGLPNTGLPVHMLKLIAFDTEDLAVLSAHLQDAVLKVGDMAYLPQEKRFAAITNRFNWEAGAKRNERRRSGLRLERVLAARVQGFDLQDKATVLSLLAIEFTPAEAPEGHVTLLFAGGAAVQLHVECIEAELKDLGPAWQTRSRPRHPDETERPG